MSIALPLDKMTISEKISAMEALWDDLCKNAPNFPSPDWHESLLAERERNIDRGDDQWVDWDAAKKDIRNAAK